MRKLINLVALVMLVSVNVLTPFIYAQEIPEDNTGMVENEGENCLDLQQSGEEENSLQVFQEEDIIQTLEIEGYENNSQLLEIDIQGENSLEEIDEDLIQEQNLNVTEVDLSNPIHLYRDGELTGTYTGLSQAITESESGDTINLIDDISVLDASIISGKSLTINGNNHTITRDADITTITVNENSSLILKDIVITDNAVNFAPNRYNSLLKAQSSIPLCLGGVIETRNESGDVIASVCATGSVDTAKTHPQIYSVGDIYGDNLTISNSLNSNGAAAMIVEKGGIEMINSNFIHNGASGGGRGGAIRVGPNTATNIVDESPITKISFLGCNFENNYSNAHGGALAFHYTPEIMTINNCVFSGNTASANGGAIHIPNIQYKPGGWLPAIPTGSLMPVGTLYINNSSFYNNWVGNDGAAIEDDDALLEIDSSKFEHNYGMQPLNTSVGVISSQIGGETTRSYRWYELKISNSSFIDTNTYVLGDHNMFGFFNVDNCLFEKQLVVLLSYNGRGEIKDSTIKDSNRNPGHCGEKGYVTYDVVIGLHDDYLSRIADFGESTMKLENNTYSNICDGVGYFQINSASNSTGVENIMIKDEINTRIIVPRKNYDNINVEGTDEIYYQAKIDGQNYAYIKRDKFYDFDEFNIKLEKWTTGYQLQSGKAMLFYLDSGYTELWSGAIHTTTALFGKETDIHNITYEGMDGVNFEGINHTYKFIKLNHTQYLTELTPYTLNTPSRNGYRFEGRYLDSDYTTPITSIEAGSTGDITIYAKWEKLGSSGGGGGGGSSKPDTSKQEEQGLTETSEQTSQGESNTEYIIQSEIKGSGKSSNTSMDSSDNASEGQNYSEEFQQAYEFAKQNGITTMSTIQKADMNGKLTRIAMAKMLSQYAINVLGQKAENTVIHKFNDVTDKQNSDYDNGVTLAYQLGIMGQNMKGNNFRPNDEVTRAEFVTALSRMLYNTSDGEYKSTSKYYTHHMEKFKEEGIITKDNPAMKELRGYVMIMLMRSAQ